LGAGETTKARGRLALIAAGLLVSGVFAYVAVRDVQPRQSWEELRSTELVWLLPALALLTVAFLLRAVRWWSLFRPEMRPPLRAVTGALFVGYVGNALLPLRAGDAAAIVTLNRRAGRPVAETTATMLVQRAQDVLSLVLLLFLMLPWLPHVSWVRAAGALGGALVVLLAVGALALLRFGDAPLRVLLRPLRSVSFIPADTLARAPRDFLDGLVGLFTPRVALVSFAWTTLSWVVLGAGFWLVMKASGLELSPSAGLLVVIGIGLAMILPSSPAAVGVFEGATVVVLSAYDVPASAALSYAIVLHALNVLPLLAAAAVVFAHRRLRPIRGGQGSTAAPSSAPTAHV
jgi:glycosyltransferase 2 family protein